MIVDGCVWQPLMWERPTSDDAGSVSHDDAPRGTAMNRTKRTRDPGASRRTSAETGEANGQDREKNSDDKVVDDVVDSLVKELDLEEEAERVDDRPGTTTTDDAFDVPRLNATRETRSSRSLPLGEESGDDLDEPRLRNKHDAADADDDDHPTISGRFDDEDPEAALPLPTRPDEMSWPTSVAPTPTSVGLACRMVRQKCELETFWRGCCSNIQIDSTHTSAVSAVPFPTWPLIQCHDRNQKGHSTKQLREMCLL